jgi:hypothetical protein
MAIVEFEDRTLCIDAAVIGQGLNVETSLVQVRMREGKITVLCERGVDEDAGRYRMTFFHETGAFVSLSMKKATPSSVQRWISVTVNFPLRCTGPQDDSKGRSGDNPIAPTGLHCTVR